MNNAVITLKTNSALKSKAMKVADDLGFSLSSLINAYLKSLVRRKTVDFSLEEYESHPSKLALKWLKEAKTDRKAGRSVSFNTEGEAVRYLDELIKKDENKLFKKVSKTIKKSPNKNKKTISRQTKIISQTSTESSVKHPPINRQIQGLSQY